MFAKSLYLFITNHKSKNKIYMNKLEYNNQWELLRKIAQAWNNLDVSYIEEEVADEVIYTSQWVFESIEGKNKLLDYLQGKFATIKSRVLSDQMKLSAELASFTDGPCIVLKQEFKDRTDKSTLLIKTMDHKIQQIDLCFIPDPEAAKLSGEIPF